MKTQQEINQFEIKHNLPKNCLVASKENPLSKILANFPIEYSKLSNLDKRSKPKHWGE